MESVESVNNTDVTKDIKKKSLKKEKKSLKKEKCEGITITKKSVILYF